MIELILTVALIGLVLYLVERLVPMDPAIVQLLRLIVIVVLVLYLLRAFGVLEQLDMPVPRLR